MTKFCPRSYGMPLYFARFLDFSSSNFLSSHTLIQQWDTTFSHFAHIRKFYVCDLFSIWNVVINFVKIIIKARSQTINSRSMQQGKTILQLSNGIAICFSSFYDIIPIIPCSLLFSVVLERKYIIALLYRGAFQQDIVQYPLNFLYFFSLYKFAITINLSQF